MTPNPITPAQWQQVYTESLAFVRWSAYFKFAVAAVLVLGGSLMSLFVLVVAKVPTIVGLLVLAICGSGAAFQAWKGYIDMTGQPIVLTAQILKKEIYTSARQNGQQSRQYFLRLDVQDAYRVDAGGNPTPLPKLHGRHKFVTRNQLWDEVNEQEEATLVATPSRELFMKLADLLAGESLRS